MDLVVGMGPSSNLKTCKAIERHHMNSKNANPNPEHVYLFNLH